MPKNINEVPQQIIKVPSKRSFQFTKEEVVGLIAFGIKQDIPREASVHIAMDPTGSMIVHITYPWQEPEGEKVNAPTGPIPKSPSAQEKAPVEEEEKPKGF